MSVGVDSVSNEPGQLPVKKSKLKNSFVRTVRIAAVSILLFGSGWAIGSGRVGFNTAEKIAELASNESGAPTDLSTDGIQDIYDKLKSNYDGDIDADKLSDGLKKGLVAAVGDTYTEYFNVEETKDFNSDLNGTFEGIGAELGKEGDFVVIIAPIKGAPAEKAGIQAKDIITEINGEKATGITVSEAVKRIRGEKGTTVTLKVIRAGEEVEVSIVRDTIDIPSVEWAVDNGIGTITISRFGDDTGTLTKKAAREFADKGVKNVILDLRGNPGGLLDQAVVVASVWLPKGATVLEEKRGGEVVKTFTTSESPILEGVKTIVMIDEGSASASEIVSGALKDNKVATLLGETSYGKGSVQQLIDLKNGGSLKVTIARWYTPAGKNIDKEGIEPDEKVERTVDDIKAGRDPQLDAAKSKF
ncbi:MAG TPA: S41 family peptidase [Candidatus Saccharibacteria bacterium]|nr:S41 family peptidase [Candidatus Saccharibacteria bacterium]